MSLSVTSSPYRHTSPLQSRRSRLSSPWQKKAQDAVLNLKFEFGPSTLIIGLFVAAVALILLYLAHFNQDATKGYDLKRLQADRQQLLTQYDVSDMRLSDAKAMTSILQSGKVSQMRHANDIIFVRADTAIASR